MKWQLGGHIEELVVAALQSMVKFIAICGVPTPPSPQGSDARGFEATGAARPPLGNFFKSSIAIVSAAVEP